jgi:hypothetical protein
MIQSFDETKCLVVGCDQGHHNYLLYSGRLLPANATYDEATSNKRRIASIEFVRQGHGMVNTLGLFCGLRKQRNKKKRTQQTLTNHDVLDKADLSTVLNFDGSISAVVHQFDRCDEILHLINERTEDMWNGWKSFGTANKKDKDANATITAAHTMDAATKL